MIPDTWDEETDVAIIGFGGAGVAVAVTAFDLGAEVLTLEKAPEGRHGGIEFPELPDAFTSHKFHDGPLLGYAKTWKRLETFVAERAIRAFFEIPAHALIQDPISGEILGAHAERDGGALEPWG